MDGELTSLKISRDSQFALINHAPDVGFFSLRVLDGINFDEKGNTSLGSSRWPFGTEVYWPTTGSTHHSELFWGCRRQFHRQWERRCVLTSAHKNNVRRDHLLLDGNVYVWHRDTGTLLEVLEGHGQGSVNSVAWNPRNERMFASCGDDCSIRIWEALPLPESAPLALPPPPIPSPSSAKGKGKNRQRWDEGDVSEIATTAAVAAVAIPTTASSSNHV
jgi:WD repeat-containing protein 26